MAVAALGIAGLIAAASVSAIYVLDDLRLLMVHHLFHKSPGNVSWATDAEAIAFETAPNLDCTRSTSSMWRAANRGP